MCVCVCVCVCVLFYSLLETKNNIPPKWYVACFLIAYAFKIGRFF